MEVKSNQNMLYSAILFFVWPLLTVIIAMYNYREKWAKNIAILFIAFYTYTRALPKGSYADILSYKWKFEAMAEMGFLQFLGGLFKDGNPELFTQIVQFLVSRFTSNYQIFFLVLGLIFDYFYSRNLWFLLERVTTKMNYVLILIFILILMNTPFWNVAGSRWMFALQVFLYGFLQYSYNNKARGMLFIFLTIFIHLSFIIPIGVFLLFLILGNRINIYFIFFMISLFFTNISGSDVRESSSLLPTVYQERIEGYTKESYIENKKASFQKARWYVGFYKKPLSYSVIVLTIILFVYYRNNIDLDSYLYKFFNFSLLFSGVANTISPFSSAARFLVLSNTLILFITFLFTIDYQNTKVTNFLKLATPFLLIFIIVAIRTAFDSTSIGTLIGNPLIAIFFEGTTPFIEYIKSVVM